MKKTKRQRLLVFLTSLSITLSMTSCKENSDENIVKSSYTISDEDKNTLLKYDDYLSGLGVDIDDCEIIKNGEQSIKLKTRIYDKYIVKNNKTIETILSLTGMNEEDFIQMNNCNKETVFDDGTELNVYYYQIYDINKKINYNKEHYYYIVLPGDYLIKIAEENDTTVEQILEINNIEDPNLILPGQELKILVTQKTEEKTK